MNIIQHWTDRLVVPVTALFHTTVRARSTHFSMATRSSCKSSERRCSYWSAAVIMGQCHANARTQGNNQIWHPRCDPKWQADTLMAKRVYCLINVCIWWLVCRIWYCSIFTKRFLKTSMKSIPLASYWVVAAGFTNIFYCLYKIQNHWQHAYI